MSKLRRFLAKSNHPYARLGRRAYHVGCTFSIPAPAIIVKPLLWCYVMARVLWHTFRRVAIAEPLFKAYCTRYGRKLRTGIYVHWVEGKGEIVLGDDVFIDGKCSIGFAARFSERPFLHIGDHTKIAHNCSMSIGKGIRIGRYCLVASNVCMFDSGGHATDPELRMQGLPPADEQVRPITLEDNVWIGRHALIFPGVTIGEGSIVCAGAVVMADVPPYTVVAGNPAKKLLPGMRNPKTSTAVATPVTLPLPEEPAVRPGIHVLCANGTGR